jgi:hypothetical protein
MALTIAPERLREEFCSLAASGKKTIPGPPKYF